METAFPALMASRFNRVKIIFDDADRISMIYNYPTIIRICIEKLERWTSRNSTIHIIPGYTRYDWQYDNMYLVRNVALKSDYDKAMTESVLVDRKIFTIYMNGWIARDTGARILLEALDKLVFIGLDIKVIVAGKIVSDDGHNLLRHKSVEYFGEIPQTEALKLYLAADIVVTLYDPAISINKHAESNKWGDCVMLNKPFVVNSEVLTARKFVDIGAAFSFDYENTDQLVNLIYELSINRDILDSAAKKLNKFREDYLPFEEQINRLMDTLYKKEVADDGL
jgi:glycosyltransferase involved in cell wall biosynthesis